MKFAVSTLALLAFATGAAHAAIVTDGGTITGLGGANNDQIDQWRSTSILKTLDPDGDNVYGTAGWILYGTDAAVNGNAGTVPTTDPLTYDPAGTQATFQSIPAFLTLTNNGQTAIASSYGYQLMDDPTLGIGPTVAELESGAAVRNGTPQGTEGTLLNITIGSGFPAAGIRLGILFGNTDVYLGNIRLTQTVGGSADVLKTQPAVPIGLSFFDIVGAVPGDVFTLALRKDAAAGGNPNVLYGGVTVDVIPEPVSSGLLACGALGLLAIRRRRA